MYVSAIVQIDEESVMRELKLYDGSDCREGNRSRKRSRFRRISTLSMQNHWVESGHSEVRKLPDGRIWEPGCVSNVRYRPKADIR